MAMNLDAVLRIAAKVVGLNEVTGLERAIGRAESTAKDARASFEGVVNSAAWQAAAVGAAAVGVAIGTSVQAAVQFEAAMADVRKVVPGLESAEGLQAMRSEILNLSRELPVSAEGLAAIMASAGQAGIAREELAGFTRQAAMMGIAFDITADEAGNAMAKLRTSLGLNQEEVVQLADAMNFLSNNMASTASEVTDFMLRVGAVGQQVAMTTEQTAALGSAMVAAGAAPEVAATSFRNLLLAMTKGESATAAQSAAFKRLGLDVMDVAKMMQVDAVGTIRDVFERISKLPEETRISTISEIFGNEARALTPLITNMKLFDQSMGLVANSTQYAGSMMAEFSARAGTSENNFILLQNNVKALQIAIGDGLLPAINLILGALTPLLSVVSELAGRFPVLTAVVVTLTAAVAALIIAAPAIVSFITLIGSLKVALAGAGIAATIAGWAGAIAPAIVAIKATLLGLMGWLSSTLLPGLLAFFTGPVGWTVLAVAAVVAMAIYFRKPIMEFFQWLGGAIGNGLQALWRWGEPIRQFWIGVWNTASGLVEKFSEFSRGVLRTMFTGMIALGYQLWVAPFVRIWEGLEEPVSRFVDGVGAILGRIAGIATRAFSTIAGTIQNVFRGVLQWIASRINSVGGMVNQLITRFNALPGPDIALVPTLTVPAFAQGGTVSRPTLAMVGEGGEREYIVPESKMAAASARFLSGQRGASVIPSSGSSGGTQGGGSAPVVNITTGPVMQMDGQNYVSIQEYQRGLRQVASQIYAELRTPGGRRGLGIA